jgi:hypothetical protein
MGRVPDAVEDSREMRTHLMDVPLEFGMCGRDAHSIVTDDEVRHRSPLFRGVGLSHCDPICLRHFQ